MSSQGIVKYFCNNCKNKRQTVILPDDHAINLTSSANGLVIYSDIHVCKGELLGVSNVHLDANYAVRGVDYLKLPEKMVQPSNGGVSIPMPTSRRINQSIPITDLTTDSKIRMEYKNFEYKFELRIGKIKTDHEPIGEVLSSDGSSSKILFYKCEIEFTANLETWFQSFIDIINEHPPKKLGLILEALIFIFENSERPIESIDEKIMHEMFRSHLIKVHLVDDDFSAYTEKLQTKFDDDTIAVLKTICADLKLNPDQTLLELAGLLTGFVKFMLNIYILEKFGIVELEKLNE